MRAGLGPCVANEATGRSCQARFVWDRVGRTLTRFGSAYYKRFLCIRPQNAPCEVERWSSLVPETANAA